MNLYNHPRLCAMSEVAARPTEYLYQISDLSRAVGREIASLEDHGSTEPLAKVTRHVWTVAAEWNEQNEQNEFGDEITKALHHCDLPPVSDTETYAVETAASALKGLAMLHRLMAHELMEEAMRSAPVPA